MNANANEADVVLNRLNVALARSQRIINSWLPPKSQTAEEEQHEDDDEDFTHMSEERGVGFEGNMDDEDDSIAHALRRRKKLSSNDKLLEQLIGKKAAQAKKKTQDSGKSMSLAKHAAPKPMISRPRQGREVESEDDEDAGRSAAFTSRRRGNAPKKRSVDPVVEDDPTSAAAVNGDVDVSGLTGSATGAKQNATDIASERHEKPLKTKGNTYLDELLAQKSRKKKKKKQNRGNTS